MAVSEQAVRGLAYIEQVFWETQSIPSQEKISDVIGVSSATVSKWFKDEGFRNALIKRGVVLHEEGAEQVLTFQQLDAIARVMNVMDKASMREKLEEAGVTTQQWNGWMRDAKFSAYLKKRAEVQFAGADTTAYMSILKQMENGSLPATQLFLEMRGIYNPKIQVEVNVDVVLTRVVEIISKHVTDPTTLALIANEIEGIDGVRSVGSPELPPVEVRATSPTTPPALPSAPTSQEGTLVLDVTL